MEGPDDTSDPPDAIDCALVSNDGVALQARLASLDRGLHNHSHRGRLRSLADTLSLPNLLRALRKLDLATAL